MATRDDIDALEEGTRKILAAEREQLRDDLRNGFLPTVYLSDPGEPPRLVQLTSRRDLDDGRLPWARLRG